MIHNRNTWINAHCWKAFFLFKIWFTESYPLFETISAYSYQVGVARTIYRRINPLGAYLLLIFLHGGLFHWPYTRGAYKVA